MRKILSLLLVALLIFGFLTGCKKEEKKEVELLGAGATFPQPLYTKMFDEYYKITGVKVNYQGIGSGGGIRQLLEMAVDFGATDAYMSDEDLKKAPAKIVHIPMALGAVVVTYNLEGNPKLKFDGKTVADIFLGKIKKWNDERIKRLNPDIDLPDMDITVVHRSDGSGTTFIFSDYLSKVSSEWKEKVGYGKSLDWPVGLGAKGNPGVAGLVKQTPGAIGYVELAYAEENGLPYAMIKNKKGNFINPSLESVSLAANFSLPDDTRVRLTDTDAEKGYPISSFTWIIVYENQNYKKRSKDKAKEVVKLLWWMIHEGQKYNEPLLYGKLPKAAVEKAEKIIKSINYDGASLLKE